jgi:hypothetical protein
VWKQLERRAAEGDNRPHSERGVSWTKGNAWIRELLQEVNVHGKADRHMRLLTIETESRLGTLWDHEGCNQFCSKEELWEAARDEEMKMPWQEATAGLPVPGRAVSRKILAAKTGLDTATKEFLAIEFKRTQDARSNYVERATVVADCFGSLDEPKRGVNLLERSVSR